MNTTYLVWSKCDDMEDMLVGIADTAEKADLMVEKLEEEFSDSFEYVIVPFEKNAITIDDVTYRY